MLQPELITAIASSVMATVVSVVALIFSYRQNVGWKPVGLVTNSKMSGTGGINRYTVTLSVEFWNRRKYPVALRFLSADITGFVALAKSADAVGVSDFVYKNKIFKQKNILVAPHGSHDVEIEVDFENQSLDAMKPLFAITLGYFDPHRRRAKTVKIKHRFFYPELGWKKSKDDIDKILAVFERIHGENELREEAASEKAAIKEMGIR